MPAPPDNGRSSSAKHVAGDGEPPLSEILRGSSSGGRRNSSAVDIVRQLDKADNTDDSPTIITPGKNPPPNLAPTTSLPIIAAGLDGSTTDAASIAGRRLGHFELLEAVGSGGMAAVLKARDLDLGRIVALKILPPESTRDPENVVRFKQEARAAAKLDHENVARVYFCGEDQGLHFIAFEFVEGETLRARIDKAGTLPPGECVRYMIQVAAGLNHAAERGVVHRDIKPSNIIITPDGRAKIVDMGLARHLESGSVNGGVTQSGVTLGTFDYISPEQALDPRRADVRSDIYSLGCTFYHALTGRPPVPEGTAAKKLRAHQLVEPLDPRMLNPAIPDELAAILGRMMVKDPERRYQSPTELIAHLKGVAEKLNLSTDSLSSDSVVHAVVANPRVLPDPPKLRAVWVVAAVAVAVAITAFAITQSGPKTGPVNPPWEGERPRVSGTSNSGDPTKATEPNPITLRPALDGFVHVNNADTLAKALADPNTTKVWLDRFIDLTRLSQPVTFEGKELELAASPNNPVRLKLHAGSDPAPGTLQFSNTAKLTVSGVRFDFVCPPEKETLQGTLEDAPNAAGLQLGGVAEVRFADCLFTLDEKLKNEGVPAVSLRNDSPEPSRVRLERCLFASGRVALQVPAKSDVRIDDSGFGPYSAAIVVKASFGETAPATIQLNRSSFMVDSLSAAVDAEAPVRVTAGFCVFAAASNPTEQPAVPGMAVPPSRGAVVRDHAETSAADTFRGIADQKNAYYRVNPLAHATPDGAVKSLTFDECRAMVTVPADDRGAVTLKQRPWEVESTATQLLVNDPFRAFRLKLTDRAVFASGVGLIGAQFHLPNSTTRRAYASDLPGWPPPQPAAAVVAETRQLIWWPNAPLADLLPPGTYTDIVKLLRDVKSGDEVLIKHDGPLPVDPARVESTARPSAERGDFRLTFKPSPGFKPVLTAAPNREHDATLFRLMDGEVTFENLQFLVKPAKRDQRSQAAVTIVGAKGCTFRGCVFTLDEDESKAAVVVVADADREMRMDPANGRPTPKVRFENCLVRGKGRGVWVPVSRPFEMDMTNCVTAIEGELVLSEPAGKDPGGATRSQVRLNRVTSLVGGPLFEMRGGKIGEMKAAGLVPIDVEVDACLFAAVPGSSKPLLELDGIDPADVERVFSWRAGKPNRYANFDASPTLAVIRPGDEAGTTKNWDWIQWHAFARDVGKPVGTVMFNAGPTSLRDLATLKSADVGVMSVTFPELDGAKSDDAGAAPRDIPKPADE